MKQILQEISQLALLLNDEEFTTEQRESGWLGYSPAAEEEIGQLQHRLQINLPEDYVLHLLAGKLNRYDELAELVRTAYTTNGRMRLTPERC